jgi:predicted transporter
MNTRSTQSGAAWLPIIIVLAIIVIGAGVYMYSQPATDGSDTATTTTEVMDQGANVSGAVDATATDVATTSDAVVN